MSREKAFDRLRSLGYDRAENYGSQIQHRTIHRDRMLSSFPYFKRTQRNIWQNKTKGYQRLDAMLKSGKELKVFTISEEHLKYPGWYFI